MHELSIAEALIDQVAQTVEREQLTKILSITVKVGTLSGVDPEALQMGFAVASEGTVAQGAKLVIQIIPAKIICKQCKKESVVDEFFFACPACSSVDVDVVQGRELSVQEISAS